MMNKTIIFIFSILLFSSCNYDKKMITKTRIGKYALGEKLKTQYDKEKFEIKIDKNNIIVSIMVMDIDYKTKEGFGVGTHFNNIKKYSNDSKERDLVISKDNIKIGSFGNSLVYNNIAFIDNNDDDVVDIVWIE